MHGPDTRRFANGMFTNNVRDLPVGAVNRHAIVDDRGRVGGFLTLRCEADDTFLAVVEGPQRDALMARLEPFIVFDDVELSAVDGLAWFTVQGEGADAMVKGVSPGAVRWPRRRSPMGGVDLLVPEAEAEAVWASLLGAGAVAADVASQERLRVAGGDPVWPRDTGARGLPHELGLRDEMLSFDKGCYLGQESINRIDVMGQVRRHLVAVRVAPAAEAPPEGTEIRTEKVVGTLTSPVALPEGGWLGLAVLRSPANEAGTSVALGPEGIGWSGDVLALPAAL